MVKITLEGDAELKAALAKIQGKIPQEVSDVVVATAIEIERDAKWRIRNGPKTGTTYYRIYDEETGFTNIFAGDSEGYVASLKGRQNLSPTHQASAPGEAPAWDTGALAGSIRFDKVGNFTAEVSSKIKYAYWLEFGTLTMAARPFMRPAVEKARPKFLARMTTAIARVIQ